MPEIRFSGGSVRQGEMLKAGDLPVLGLDGADLTFIHVDHQARLQFGDIEVAIATPFRLESSDEAQTLDPEEREKLGPLLALYPASLASATVEADLMLRLDFERAEITAPQDPRYEAWQLVGPGTRLIVCPPAGDGTLAVWR